MTAESRFRICPLCEATCGLELTVEGREVLAIRGDGQDAFSEGYVCPKGVALRELDAHPNRLRTPMLRRGEAWSAISWDEAFAEIERRLLPILEAHGRDAVGIYLGNPTVHNTALSIYAPALIRALGTKNVFTASTVDQIPQQLVCALMYGTGLSIPIPDIDRTQYLLILGANPLASNGSMMTAPNFPERLRRVRRRGGKVVVIDPRRTGTADRADEWIPIVPGTDAAFLLAVVNVLFADGLVDLGDVHDFVNGVAEVEAAAREFAPEVVAATCGIDAPTIRRIAHEIAAAPSAAVYGRIGLCNQEFGTLASWLIDVVNVLTGNFDRPGGMMFGNPIAWSVSHLDDPQWADGVSFGRWRSRVRGTPEVLGQVPVSCLAEEIDTPDDAPGLHDSPTKQIKALITIAGNPVISAPDAGRLDAALPLLECMISVDNWLNETTRHAHVILPGLSALEAPHYDDLILAWAARTFGNYSPPVFDVPDGRPREWQTLIVLGAMCMGMRWPDIDVRMFDDGFFAVACEAQGVDPAVAMAHYEDGGPERLLDLQIRTGPFGDRYGEVPDGLTLQHFRDAPHGIDLGPMVPMARHWVKTPSGRIELAPEYILADLPRLRARLDRPRDALVLVSRRHVRSNNSWMHNVKVLVKGKDRCTLLVHPDDAARLRLVDGGVARVTSEAGSVEVPVEVLVELEEVEIVPTMSTILLQVVASFSIIASR